MNKLQPLRIPTGWSVKYNSFTEYDPDDAAEHFDELCEDLLQLENGDLLIDLGWYPEGDITGQYRLYLLDGTKALPFEMPLEIFNSRSKQEIIEKIELWTNYEQYSK